MKRTEPRRRRSYRDDSFTDDVLEKPTKEFKTLKTTPTKKLNTNIKRGADKIHFQNVRFEKHVSPLNKDLYNDDDNDDIDDDLDDDSDEEVDDVGEDDEPIKSRDANSKSILFSYIVFVIFAMIVVVGAAYYFNANSSINSYFIKDEPDHQDKVKSILEDVKKSLRNMRTKYKNQDYQFWQDAYISIANIIEAPHKPSILLLIGDKADPTDCLAVLLGNISSNALRSHSLLLTPEKFKSDMGSVIESLRVSIQDNKAVIIWDLFNINIEALKAFHNLCDTVNPLVEEVIYIITVISDEYDKEESPLEFMERELYKKLTGKIKEDAIQPLITRITDGAILSVNSEPSVDDCPLPKATTL
ncbi:hypothetical protein TKK_0018970 [Trichogramma kaykai]